MRKCNKCFIEKVLLDFPKNKYMPLGRNYTCNQCMKQITAEYRAKNPDKRKATVKRSNDKPESRQRMNKWRRDNPDKQTPIRNRYRARKLGNGGKHTAAEWQALKNGYGNRCLACGCSMCKLTEDHVLPLAMGGTDDIGNIQPLCRSCNSRKHAKYIDYRHDK